MINTHWSKIWDLADSEARNRGLEKHRETRRENGYLDQITRYTDGTHRMDVVVRAREYLFDSVRVSVGSMGQYPSYRLSVPSDRFFTSKDPRGFREDQNGREVDALCSIRAVLAHYFPQ